MRSRVAAAVSHGFAPSRVGRLVATAAALAVAVVGLGAGVASAATVHVASVLGDGIAAGLTGQVGVVAVLAGAVGLTLGLVRRRRKALARKARRTADNERAARATENAPVGS